MLGVLNLEEVTGQCGGKNNKQIWGNQQEIELVEAFKDYQGSPRFIAPTLMMKSSTFSIVFSCFLLLDTYQWSFPVSPPADGWPPVQQYELQRCIRWGVVCPVELLAGAAGGTLLAGRCIGCRTAGPTLSSGKFTHTLQLKNIILFNARFHSSFDVPKTLKTLYDKGRYFDSGEIV